MSFSWGIFFLVLYIYRAAISVIAQIFVSRVTTLGDSSKYLRHERDATEALSAGSTSLTEFMSTVLRTLTGGSDILVNLSFMTIGYLGIVMFMLALPFRYRLLAAVLVMLPSFNLWTSITSKEAVILFFAGMFGAFVAQSFLGHQRIRWWYLVSVPCLAFYKIQYLPGVLFMLALVTVPRFVRQPATLALVSGIVSMILLYIFRDVIDDYSFQIPIHFLSGTGLSTREVYWIDKYDVFYKAPYGMWLAFFGPTLSEAQSGHVLHVFSFVESSVVLAILSFVFLSELPRRPAFSFFALLFVIFWLMFPNYPFGVMNPGSAVRYRAGYYLLVVAAVMAFSSRDGFTRWRSQGLRSLHA